MSGIDKLPKGAVLEEILRAYFLRAGFFVIRGVPFRFSNEDLTDVDLWLYERPTGTTRRVQICDAKYKQRPKAIERIFWTRGLADALGVDGAYVATTDKRKNLRSVANKLNLQLIDGSDIQRIQSSQSIIFPSRIDDERMIAELQAVDREFRSKDLQDARLDILSSLSEGFGAPSVVRSLESFGRLANATVGYYPCSGAARAAGRLAYLAAAIACESLDYVSVGAAFRTIDERRELMLNAVRLGALSDEDGRHALDMALALVEKYAPGGRGAAIAMQVGLKKDLEQIPAEIVADQAVRLLRADQLFLTGRELEMASYHVGLPPFDSLSVHAKSMLGALLDFSGVDRERFAKAWTASGGEASPTPSELVRAGVNEESAQFNLFGTE
ncbi:hypothetical protein [Rhodanobacter hydrolyticus]|uniref:Restriction endonuclease type IV Mrr domain-containing protein n=1 Tax=Rhodanobacter hydrolyticus TaxID=2250595 RepID=A0ABW8J320_9GAMM